MSNIKFGKYYNITSNIHNMDTTYKLICIILFSLILILANNILLISIMSVFTILLIFVSNVPIKLYIKSLYTILSLVIFIILINLIFNVSMISTILSITKLILIVFYTSVFMFTTKPNDINTGLEKLLRPLEKFKLNPRVISLTITLVIRFIPIIFENGEKVLKSQASRGLDFRSGGIKTKVKSLTSILLPMFMLSFKRADDIADIMELRLYDVNKRLPKSKILIKNEFDNTILASHLLLLFIFILKEVIRL